MTKKNEKAGHAALVSGTDTDLHGHAAYVEKAKYTQKGVLLSGSGVGTVTGLGLGDDGEILKADSASPGGISWGGVDTHTHTAPDGGQLDWDNIWTDAAHSHQAAGEGSQLDHGAAHTAASMQDDDHGIYLKESEYPAKGAILAGTGSGTFAALTLGTNTHVLTADSAQSNGVKWATAIPKLNACTAPDGAVNFNQQQATSLVIENRASDPGSPVTGQIWLRTDL